MNGDDDDDDEHDGNSDDCDYNDADDDDACACRISMPDSACHFYAPIHATILYLHYPQLPPLSTISPNPPVFQTSLRQLQAPPKAQ